jgi:hypothetical protein
MKRVFLFLVIISSLSISSVQAENAERLIYIEIINSLDSDAVVQFTSYAPDNQKKRFELVLKAYENTSLHAMIWENSIVHAVTGYNPPHNGFGLYYTLYAFGAISSQSQRLPINCQKAVFELTKYIMYDEGDVVYVPTLVLIHVE